MFNSKAKIKSNRKVIQKKLRVIITNSCNLNCKDCFNEWNPQRGKLFAKIQDIYSAIRNLEYSVLSIKLTGGEPLLHPDINEFCKQLEDFAPVSITTNGLLLSACIDTIPVNIPVTISLYGKTALEFSNHTQVSLIYFYKQIEQLEIVKSNPHRTFFANIIIKDSSSWNFSDWLEFALNFKFKKVRFLTKLGAINDKIIYQNNVESVEKFILSNPTCYKNYYDPSTLSCRYGDLEIQLIRQYYEFDLAVQKTYGFIWINPNGSVNHEPNFDIIINNGFK